MPIEKVRKSSLEATLKGSAIPTVGTFNQGDVLFNSTVGAGQPTGWVCTVAGTPGTWMEFGSRYISHSEALDPNPINGGAYQAVTSTVTGAVLGDFVESSFSLDLAGCSLHSYVSAADTVTSLIRNNTASIVNLGAGTLSIRVNKK